MNKRITSLCLLACGLCLFRGMSVQNPPPNRATAPLEIWPPTVNDSTVPLHGKGVSLGSFPKNIAFNFGPETNAGTLPVRIRYKLEGYDSQWRDASDDMFLEIRYYNGVGDQISQNIFRVSGESPGWNGSLKTSPLTHRRQWLTVPPQASRLMVVISSAGPPNSVGVYVVANLTVSKSSGDTLTRLLKEPSPEHDLDEETNNAVLEGWMRDGIRRTMAQVVTIGETSPQRVLAVLDNDRASHAEWHTTLETSPAVSPGQRILVDWDEMFSIGDGDITAARYPSLPEGTYQFHVGEFDIYGNPTGNEASISVTVPPPFWRMAWFWSVVVLTIVVLAMAGGRYLIWRKLRREMVNLKNQQELERERLRIAHDIHDDLGARVTQISLLSGMSQNNPAFPQRARADFDQISKMSRELVSALYQTVWAVNPENDNLDALVNYLCQMVNQLCAATQFGCRFHMLDLPREIQVSSQIRHNISMAVKEAVHNAIKHSKGSEVTIHLTFTDELLNLHVQDDGCGFRTVEGRAGNGLTNMKRRLETIGGECVIDSQMGTGTTINMRVAIRSSVMHPIT